MRDKHSMELENMAREIQMLERDKADLRAQLAEEKARGFACSAELEGVLEQLAAANRRLEEAEKQEPVGYIDKDGYRWRADTTMDKERWGMRPLYTSPMPLPDMNVPTMWTHSCNVLCQDGVELWIESCPHCGKSRTRPIPPEDVADK